MKFQIIADSASDLTEGFLDGTGIGFITVPLTLHIGDKEFVDNAQLDPSVMLAALHAHKGKTSSACPAPASFLKEFDNAEFTFVTTITSKLSGCYNSAVVAKDMYANPERVCIIDSKATCGTEILIVEKLVELINAGKTFSEIISLIEKYRDECTLLFVLQKFDNLIANGRMSKIAGLIASVIMVRPICKAEDGEIKIAKKIIGAKNAFKKLNEMIGEFAPNTSGRSIIISECEAKEEALELKAKIEETYHFANIRILPMRGLASYYALEKGVIVCF